MDGGVIYRMGAAAVAVKERETLGQLFAIDNQRVLEAHLFHQLLGGLDSLVACGYGQGETQLGLAVVHGVAVWLYLGKV